MPDTLAMRTTLGIIPLYVGILLRHYYYKLVKGKNKERYTVRLRRKELMYDEVFTITRVSYGPFCLFKLS